MTPCNALPLWKLPTTTNMTLLAERENRVYRLDVPDEAPTVLRVHRLGYRSDSELLSELRWMIELNQQGMLVPSPIPSANNSLLEHVEGYQIDRLTWLEGAPLGKSGHPLALDNRLLTLGNLGKCMAQLHSISDNWPLPEGFTRSHWNAEGLVGEQPLWGRFWENPRLSKPQQKTLIAVRDRLREILADHAASLDYGLIHADIIGENVMIQHNKPYLLDFDDAGFGFRLFELATTLLKMRDEPDYAQLQTALVSGYTNERILNVSLLPTFILLRALSYVGWIVPRIDESDGLKRCEVHITRAMHLTEEFLEQ